VLAAPRAAINILSVGALHANGVSFSILKDEPMKLTDECGITFASCPRRGSLYELQMRMVYPPSAAANAVTKTPKIMTLYEAHVLFGHIGRRALLKLADTPSIGISITDRSEFSCKTCLKAKAKRKPFVASGNARAAQHGDRIHIDTALLERDQFGFCGFTVICDECTGETTARAFKSKAEASDFLISTIEWYKTQFEINVKVVRGANDTEIFNTRTRAFCDQRGIEIQNVPPNSPGSNGTAENAVKLVKERMRCLIIDSGLPAKIVWVRSMAHAIFLINHTPQNYLEWLSPHEAFTGQTPDLSSLMRFGSPVHYVITDRKPSLGSRTATGKFVGMDGPNYWIMTDTSPPRVIKSRDVYPTPSGAAKPQAPSIIPDASVASGPSIIPDAQRAISTSSPGAAQAQGDKNPFSVLAELDEPSDFEEEEPAAAPAIMMAPAPAPPALMMAPAPKAVAPHAPAPALPAPAIANPNQQQQ